MTNQHQTNAPYYTKAIPIPGPITPQPYDPTSPDAAATQHLLTIYSDQDGFHCPVCHCTITNPTDAVEHMAAELNAALERLRQEVK